MKSMILSLLILCPLAHAIELRPTSTTTEGDVCGTIFKVGDIEEGRSSLMFKSEAGEVLKIYIESSTLATSSELLRAALAMANDLRYCARVTLIDETSADLVESSVEKK